MPSARCSITTHNRIFESLFVLQSHPTRRASDLSQDGEDARVVSRVARRHRRIRREARRRATRSESTRLNSSHLVISYAVLCLKQTKHHPAALQSTNDRPG